MSYDKTFRVYVVFVVKFRLNKCLIPIHESLDTNNIFLILPLTALCFLICINFRVKWYHAKAQV